MTTQETQNTNDQVPQNIDLNSPEVQELAKLLAAALAKQGVDGVKSAGKGVAQGGVDLASGAAKGVIKMIAATAEEIKGDLKDNPKRFRIGVQRLLAACLLSGGVSLFTGVAIGLGDPANLACQAPAIEQTAQQTEEAAPGVPFNVNALESE